MRRVAIFGNAGGGKSTLARDLAHVTGLPWFSLDKVQYRPGGGRVPHAEYLEHHADLIGRDRWIIDGFGCVPSAWARFAAADVLIHVDLPLHRHYWWVTKRLLLSPLRSPEGWPDRSPIWRSTVDSWRVVGRCDRTLTPRYRELVRTSYGKETHHLTSPREMRLLLQTAASPGREPTG